MKYWEQVSTEWQQRRPDELWRAHSDAVNRQWLASWWPRRNVERALKTDMFDEAVGEGVFGLLKSRARFAVGMDIALATRAERWPRWWRVVFACDSPLIPLVRLWQLWQISPALVIGLAVAGYAAGTGGSARKLARFEFHRED